MNHRKTGNPQSLKLYAESKGDKFWVAATCVSSPVYFSGTTQVRRGCRTKLHLETQLWCTAVRTLGRWEGKALSNVPPRAEGHCFVFLLQGMARPVFPVWSVWTLLSSCLPARMCVRPGQMSNPRSIKVTYVSQHQPCSSHVSGKKSALQGFPAVMLFCAAAGVELSLEDTRIFVPQYLFEKHQYFLSCLDLYQWKGTLVS